MQVKIMIDNSEVFNRAVPDSSKMEIRLDGQIVYPEPSVSNPPPAPAINTGALFKPKTASELQSAWQNAVDNRYVLQLDSTTKLQIDKTIQINVQDEGGKLHGLDGNHANFDSLINDGSPAIKIASVGPNRSMVLERFSLYGGGYDGRVSGGIVIQSGAGPIYKMQIANVDVFWCTNGMSLIGDVYESVLREVRMEDNFEDGLVLIDNGADKVISNLMIVQPYLSRNWGYGMRLGPSAHSADVTHGSFINNGKGGILAPNGIRSVAHTNFENSGFIAIDIGYSPWGSTLVFNELSSQGATIHQQAAEKYNVGGQVLVKPARYLYRFGDAEDKLVAPFNKVSYYGDAANTASLRSP